MSAPAPTAPPRRWRWRVGFIAAVAVVSAVTLPGPVRHLAGAVTGSPAGRRHSPCLPGQEVPVLDSPHVPRSRIGRAQYNSVPPTSGPQFAFTVPPGIYDTFVSNGLTVHAMENGHVIVHYSPTLPADQVEALRRLAKRYPADVVLMPNPAVASGVAVTAWGRIDRMDAFDGPRVATFVERLRGRYDHGWTSPTDCP